MGVEIEAKVQTELDGSTYAEVSLKTYKGSAVFWSTRNPERIDGMEDSLVKTKSELATYLSNHIEGKLGVVVYPRTYRVVKSLEEVYEEPKP